MVFVFTYIHANVQNVFRGRHQQELLSRHDHETWFVEIIAAAYSFQCKSSGQITAIIPKPYPPRVKVTSAEVVIICPAIFGYSFQLCYSMYTPQTFQHPASPKTLSAPVGFPTTDLLVVETGSAIFLNDFDHVMGVDRLCNHKRKKYCSWKEFCTSW